MLLGPHICFAAYFLLSTVSDDGKTEKRGKGIVRREREGEKGRKEGTKEGGGVEGRRKGREE